MCGVSPDEGERREGLAHRRGGRSSGPRWQCMSGGASRGKRAAWERGARAAVVEKEAGGVLGAGGEWACEWRRGVEGC